MISCARKSTIKLSTERQFDAATSAPKMTNISKIKCTKGRDQSEDDLGSHEKDALKRVLKTQDVRRLIGLIWLMTGSNGGRF